MALVTKILKAEPDLPIPVPIEDLARQLDITEIRVLAADGFEGGLINLRTIATDGEGRRRNGGVTNGGSSGGLVIVRGCRRYNATTP